MTESGGKMAVLAKIARIDYQRADAEDSSRRIFDFFGAHLGPAAQDADSAVS